MNSNDLPSLDGLREQHPGWLIQYDAASGRYTAMPVWRHDLKAREAPTLYELAIKIRFMERIRE